MSTAPSLSIFSPSTSRSPGAVQAGLPAPSDGPTFLDQVSQALDATGPNGSATPGAVLLPPQGVAGGYGLATPSSADEQSITESGLIVRSDSVVRAPVRALTFLTSRNALAETGLVSQFATPAETTPSLSLGSATAQATSDAPCIAVAGRADQISGRQDTAAAHDAAGSAPASAPSQPGHIRAPNPQAFLSNRNPPAQAAILPSAGEQPDSAELKTLVGQRQPTRKSGGKGALRDQAEATTPDPQSGASLNVMAAPIATPMPLPPVTTDASGLAGPVLSNQGWAQDNLQSRTPDQGSNETVSNDSRVGAADPATLLPQAKTAAEEALAAPTPRPESAIGQGRTPGETMQPTGSAAASNKARNSPTMPSPTIQRPAELSDEAILLANPQIQTRPIVEPAGTAIDSQAAINAAANVTLQPTAATPAKADRIVPASGTVSPANGPGPLPSALRSQGGVAVTAIAGDKIQDAARNPKAAEAVDAAQPNNSSTDTGALHGALAAASAHTPSESQTASALQSFAQSTPATAAITHSSAPAPTLPPVPQAVVQSSPPPPSAQLGLAFATLTGAGTPETPQSLVIRLDPLELGKVEVRIDRTDGGPARVELAVERTDTLMTLLQDRPQLDKALDLAGVPPEGRTLQFSLSSPGHGSSLAGFGPGSNGGSGGHGAWGGRNYPGHSSSSGGEPERKSRSIWLRDGIDITA